MHAITLSAGELYQLNPLLQSVAGNNRLSCVLSNPLQIELPRQNVDTPEVNNLKR